jgi:hypothetical protein
VRQAAPGRVRATAPDLRRHLPAIFACLVVLLLISLLGYLLS